MKTLLVLPVALVLSACASVEFNASSEGAVYYEPTPYLFFSRTEKCVTSATPVTLPGAKRYLDFKSGYGSSSLSAEFSNGLLTKIGQTSDTKVPETLTSIAGLATALKMDSGGGAACAPVSILYPIVNGVPDTSQPINLFVDP